METRMSIATGAHILMFPFPAQGHLIPLLDLAHQLACRGLTITILVTPKNLPLLNPLLSVNPSIDTLVLPFPPHPSIPHGVENVKDLPANRNSLTAMLRALCELHDPLVNWFSNHPSPPVAIISDFFLGWTQKLACQLGIPRIVFSPSGAKALSVIYSFWTDLPKRNLRDDPLEVITLSKLPNSPKFPWWQVSPIYRIYEDGGPDSEFIKDQFCANLVSWGIVINSFSELERVYLDHLAQQLGDGGDRVWAVGPLHPPGDDLRGSERGGSSSVSVDDVLSWLDTCEDQKVVYVCFGSMAVLNNRQMEEVATALEKSQVRFVWSVKKPTKGHVEGEYGEIPNGFEDRVTGRGLVIRGWAPQVSILSHRAVGAFLTHCGWNSILEAVGAGVPMLSWPRGADQFSNAGLVVDELKVGVRVCEGEQVVPKSTELARMLAEAVSDENRVMKDRAMELRRSTIEANKEGGTSVMDLDGFVKHLQAHSFCK